MAAPRDCGADGRGDWVMDKGFREGHDLKPVEVGGIEADEDAKIDAAKRGGPAAEGAKVEEAKRDGRRAEGTIV